MKRSALTLVEMLVAMAITLIMMGAVVTIFGTVGNSVSGSRATMEIMERIRNARNVLQRDLGNVTVTMLPPRRPESDEGFFEYIEGSGNDMIDMSGAPNSEGYGLRGDSDDVLAFTARTGETYTGNVNGSAMQSKSAEIVYFTAIAPNTPTIVSSTGTTFQLKTLYRRVMLINPTATYPAASSAAFQVSSDLSCHKPTGTNVVGNTLGDVTKRENRFGHDATNPLVQAAFAPLGGSRIGEDVLLTNVLSFDVKAFDQMATVKVDTNNVALIPSDKGYADPAATAAGKGAYVDLNYSSYVTPVGVSNFSTPGNSTLQSVYDTWSLSYEAGGTGLNGLDDDVSGNPGFGIVDDLGEMTTPPPYPFPLRGIQIKIRVYEPDSRQIREVTVVQDFLPQ